MIYHRRTEDYDKDNFICFKDWESWRKKQNTYLAHNVLDLLMETTNFPTFLKWLKRVQEERKKREDFTKKYTYQEQGVGPLLLEIEKKQENRVAILYNVKIFKGDSQ